MSASHASSWKRRCVRCDCRPSARRSRLRAHVRSFGRRRDELPAIPLNASPGPCGGDPGEPSRACKGAGLDFDKLLASGRIKEIIYVHDDDEVEELNKKIVYGGAGRARAATEHASLPLLVLWR